MRLINANTFTNFYWTRLKRVNADAYLWAVLYMFWDFQLIVAPVDFIWLNYNLAQEYLRKM